MNTLGNVLYITGNEMLAQGDSGSYREKYEETLEVFGLAREQGEDWAKLGYAEALYSLDRKEELSQYT